MAHMLKRSRRGARSQSKGWQATVASQNVALCHGIQHSAALRRIRSAERAQGAGPVTGQRLAGVDAVEVLTVISCHISPFGGFLRCRSTSFRIH